MAFEANRFSAEVDRCELRRHCAENFHHRGPKSHRPAGIYLGIFHFNPQQFVSLKPALDILPPSLAAIHKYMAAYAPQGRHFSAVRRVSNGLSE